MTPYAPDEAWARARDAEDPLAGFRDEFHLPTGTAGSDPLVYFCGNSLGLMPRRVPELVAQELKDWGRLAVEGHLEAATPWYSYHENFRAGLARLVGAEPEEVVAMNALTVNLHLMMVSFYRPTPGRHKVLIEEAAFPSDAYAVASHVATRGYDPAKAVIVARPRPGEHTMRTDDLEAIFDERGTEIALALLPGVQYYTGQRLELSRLVRTAQVAGAKVGLDLAHAIGNVPLALHDWNVDFAAWCHYKYLNAGPGAVGGCFVHERHADNHKLQRFAGWWGNDPATRFRLHLNEEFVPRTGADGWQISNPQMLSLTPLIAAIDQFDRAGLGPLREKSLQLTGYLEFLIDRLPSDRIRIITPRDPEQRGCQLSLLVAQDARALFESVRDRGIVADFRQPDVIRLAPVPLYNSFHEVWRVGRAFEELLGG